MDNQSNSMVLVEKAWVLKSFGFDEPWHVPDDVFYGETKGKAKTNAMNAIRYDGLKTSSGDDVTFTNIPLVRAKQYDKYMIDGVVKPLATIEHEGLLQKRRDKLMELVVNNPNGKAYIRKGGYYYRPGYCGYTERINDAGVYTIEEAVGEVLGTGVNDNMWVVVIIPEEHNKMIQQNIEELKQRLI
jgi:hypothetical protein